jgi:hypothetical protein
MRTNESHLDQFPEVTWDRWAGDKETVMVIFGWIPRDDGRSDFVVLRLEYGSLVSLVTSSARYSKEFAGRTGLGHGDCKRVEHDFPELKSCTSSQEKL